MTSPIKLALCIDCYDPLDLILRKNKIVTFYISDVKNRKDLIIGPTCKILRYISRMDLTNQSKQAFSFQFTVRASWYTHCDTHNIVEHSLHTLRH